MSSDIHDISKGTLGNWSISKWAKRFLRLIPREGSRTLPGASPKATSRVQQEREIKRLRRQNRRLVGRLRRLRRRLADQEATLGGLVLHVRPQNPGWPGWP